MNENDWTFPANWKDQLAQKGHFAAKITLKDNLIKNVKKENWQAVDHYFKQLTAAGGELFNYLSNFEYFKDIEFIISVRDANNEWEEDGIWHDDGSRKLAFSLSLNLNADFIDGGVLELRKKNSQNSFLIPPFSFGEIVIFATGKDHFEHKINRVTKGRRIIIAGWCQ